MKMCPFQSSLLCDMDCSHENLYYMSQFSNLVTWVNNLLSHMLWSSDIFLNFSRGPRISGKCQWAQMYSRKISGRLTMTEWALYSQAPPLAWLFPKCSCCCEQIEIVWLGSSFMNGKLWKGAILPDIFPKFMSDNFYRVKWIYDHVYNIWFNHFLCEHYKSLC